MKAAIVYASVHHGNTKKLVDAIAEKYNVTLIDATKAKEQDMSSFDLIGFASGIYFYKYHQSVMNFASINMPQEKDTFLICTYGGSDGHASMEKILKEKNCRIVGKYACKGYDTYGPFKLVGGLKKGHPTDDEIAGAVSFYEELVK
ncbi:MAG: flavodoxin family protein [Lachnospiraceae bacterium]|nr:flavodoxin family protein [Lachnospiraceae bacterium]